MRIIINLIKLMVIAVWMITCFYICRMDDGFNYYLYWILCGFPFGIRRMCMLLIPRNFGIAGSMGVLAVNAIVGGFIGGFILIATAIRSFFGMFVKVGSV